MKETGCLEKYLIPKGEQFIFALVSGQKTNCDCMFFGSLLVFMEMFYSIHGEKSYFCF